VERSPLDGGHRACDPFRVRSVSHAGEGEGNDGKCQHYDAVLDKAEIYKKNGLYCVTTQFRGNLRDPPSVLAWRANKGNLNPPTVAGRERKGH